MTGRLSTGTAPAAPVAQASAAPTALAAPATPAPVAAPGPAALVPAAPANLHISVTSRASSAPRLRERVEQKFFVRPDRMYLALALLCRTCRRDPEFPIGQVNSLYFDTFDLEEHRRSDAGDSNKDKIRIRWYGNEFDPHRRGALAGVPATGLPPATPWAAPGHASAAPAAAVRVTGGPAGPAVPQTVDVWLERKTRRGFSSTKQRIAVDVRSSALAFSTLGRGIVPPALLFDTMAGFGFFPPSGRFCPVIAISYWRYRFVEPCTGFRVSIDSRIRSSPVMLGLGRGERGLELPGAVVEIKGPVFDIPPALRPLAEIGSSWTRYSKYSGSLDAHAADLGTVSRSWPSGVLEPVPGHIGRVEAPERMVHPGMAQGVQRDAVFEAGIRADLTGQTLKLDSEG